MRIWIMLLTLHILYKFINFIEYLLLDFKLYIALIKKYDPYIKKYNAHWLKLLKFNKNIKPIKLNELVIKIELFSINIILNNIIAKKKFRTFKIN